MFGSWQDYRIIYTKHFLLKISERGINREEVESALKDEKKLCLALENQKKKVWEAYFRKSDKYQLKVVLSADDDSEAPRAEACGFPIGYYASGESRTGSLRCASSAV